MNLTGRVTLTAPYSGVVYLVDVPAHSVLLVESIVIEQQDYSGIVTVDVVLADPLGVYPDDTFLAGATRAAGGMTILSPMISPTRPYDRKLAVRYSSGMRRTFTYNISAKFELSTP